MMHTRNCRTAVARGAFFNKYDGHECLFTYRTLFI